MNIDTGSLVTFIIMWGIPTFLVIRSYLKMDTDDKKSTMNNFKSRRFIIIGVLFIHLDILFTNTIIKISGIGLLLIGGIFSTIDMWKFSKIKSLLNLILISIAVFLS
ncbi:hypothetical protein J2Z23_004255 [Lederbergia galactosidilyticus]|uniref:hypothetical protein n=1 Tax=Lederbergia galactosidilytica TaxID=217031 RepID=UPI001AE34177|nr:hypothetical protein [Lederbergia galactosidilytica]MBP1917269.1 hypothetical protein [Lederbergia galactosidilytica]